MYPLMCMGDIGLFIAIFVECFDGFIGIHYTEAEAEIGAGEAGIVGAIAAVWCAVNDALRPMGAQATVQPFTPERMLKALREGTAG